MSNADASRRRVLVVDDDPMVRRYLQRLLVIEGYEVCEAEDGDSALELIRREPPDLVLLDVMLPSRDGDWAQTDDRRSPDVAHHHGAPAKKPARKRAPARHPHRAPAHPPTFRSSSSAPWARRPAVSSA